MARHHPFVLSDTLRTALERFAAALVSGGVATDLLDDLVVLLDGLPADAIVAAERAVKDIADLTIRAAGGRPGLVNALRHGRPSHAELLLKTPGLARVFIFHGDGYLREAALNRLREGAPSPFLLAAIAYRMNDWVPQVRAAAEACAGRVFPLTAAEIVAVAGPLLLGWKEYWSRWPRDTGVLETALQRPDVVEAMTVRFRTATTGPLAAQLRSMLRWPGLDRHLPELARHAVQPSVRAAALGFMIEGRVSWPIGSELQWIDKPYGIAKSVVTLPSRAIVPPATRAEWIAHGVADRSAAVRRIAVIAMIKCRGELPGVYDLARRLIADKSKPVRERAAYLLSVEPGAVGSKQ